MFQAFVIGIGAALAMSWTTKYAISRKRRLSPREQNIQRLLEEGHSPVEAARLSNSSLAYVLLLDRQRKRAKIREAVSKDVPSIFSKEQRIYSLWLTGLSSQQIAKRLNIDLLDIEAAIGKFLSY